MSVIPIPDVEAIPNRLLAEIVLPKDRLHHY
jgi:hypothetical protein